MLEDQKILFRGDVKNKEGENSEMFFMYTAKDERDPHSFIMSDQYYINGLVKDWSIREIDFIQAERDNEIMVSAKYRWWWAL